MFVDASAIVSILTGEIDRDELAARLDAVDNAMTSPIAIFEAVAAIVRKEELSVSRAEVLVRKFLREARVEVTPINDEIGKAALQAFARLGRRSGHPARLNMGDCFAYAMAQQHGIPLLYKGDDFAQTDLA